MNNKFYIYIIYILLLQFSLSEVPPVFKSVLLPGLGEHSLGNTKRAKQFYFHEVGIWLTFIGLKTLSDLYESDYKAFASLHAGVNMSNKDYDYAVIIGDYDSYEDFIDAQLRQRDNIFYTMPENSGYEWDWDTQSNRLKFDKIRYNSGLLNKYTIFTLGGLVVNRIISMIDVLYLQREKRKYKIKSGFNNDWNGRMQYSIKFLF